MAERIRTWLITGCSSGFGRILSEELLARGERVLMTVRRPATVADLLAQYPRTARSFILDVADLDQIRRVIAEAETVFGGIDVLVNNAGYALFGGVEEASPSLYRELFDTNFFGALEVMRGVLPGMRKRRSGRIINISSMAGISGGLGMGFYAATKFALTAVSESLALETAGMGIKVTLIEPGAHRTAVRANWKMADAIEGYDHTIGRVRRLLEEGAGREPGDPYLAVLAIIRVADAESPPLHLPLGQDALDRAETKMAAVAADIDSWRDLIISTTAG
jgi:NAD(P)-dependent dehydrogenase (short-subunit alcohol dehydrogenase family)